MAAVEKRPSQPANPASCLPVVILLGMLDLTSEVTRFLSAPEQSDSRAAAQVSPRDQQTDNRGHFFAARAARAWLREDLKR
jgi:hypothetical protein